MAFQADFPLVGRESAQFTATFSGGQETYKWWRFVRLQMTPVKDTTAAYIRSGVTARTKQWLSLTNGGAALDPTNETHVGKIFRIASEGELNGTKYLWNKDTQLYDAVNDGNPITYIIQSKEAGTGGSEFEKDITGLLANQRYEWYAELGYGPDSNHITWMGNLDEGYSTEKYSASGDITTATENTSNFSCVITSNGKNSALLTASFKWNEAGSPPTGSGVLKVRLSKESLWDDED